MSRRPLPESSTAMAATILSKSFSRNRRDPQRPIFCRRLHLSRTLHSPISSTLNSVQPSVQKAFLVFLAFVTFTIFPSQITSRSHCHFAFAAAFSSQETSFYRSKANQKRDKRNLFLKTTRPNPPYIARHPLVMSSQQSGNGEMTPISLRAGFIGCGTIASSIATGLASTYLSDQTRHLLSGQGLSLSSICVTRRSEAKSASLRESFPSIVTIYDSPEEIVKNSDCIFLCVLPEHVDEILGGLKGSWEERHTLVSLASTSDVDHLIEQTGLPKDRVYKMICLPPISQRQGCTLLQPLSSHPYLKKMLNALGGCIECPTDDIMNAMMIPGCLMGPMYGIMRNNREWLVKQGVPPEDASYFVGRTYLSIVQDAERNCRDPERFDALIAEQTPGGLNEQSLKNLENEGVFDAYNRTMDAILSRLQGKSDGSLT